MGTVFIHDEIAGDKRKVSEEARPSLYASIHYENREKFELSGHDIKAINRFTKIKKGKIIDAITKMFAPSIIGFDIIKKGLLLSAVSSSEDINLNGNRDRIHVLLVGNPGIGKSKLIKESVRTCAKQQI